MPSVLFISVLAVISITEYAVITISKNAVILSEASCGFIARSGVEGSRRCSRHRNRSNLSAWIF